MTGSIDIGALIAQLDSITDHAKYLEARFAEELAHVHPDYDASARNLIDYLALRHADIRDLQEQLAFLGLSSLGGAEKDVMASVRAVRNALSKISTGADFDLDEERSNFEQSNRRIEAHIEHALGAGTEGRDVRIMVTLPP